jgi:ribulose 1,5-bisphosphate synthetase/thiazole synthase
MESNQRQNVDILIVGGGPATLGLLTKAKQVGKFDKLSTSIAILESGKTLGGGNL